MKSTMRKISVGLAMLCGIVGISMATFTDVDTLKHEGKTGLKDLITDLDANFAMIEDGSWVGNTFTITFDTIGGLSKATASWVTECTWAVMTNGSYITFNDLKLGTSNLAQRVITVDDNTAGSEDVKEEIKIYVGGTARTVLSLAAAIAIGDGSETVAINSSDWDIDAQGNMTGIGNITANGNASFGSNVTATTANFTGAGVIGGGLTVTGTVTATMFSGSGAGLGAGSVSNTVLATGIDASKLTGNASGLTSATAAGAVQGGNLVALTNVGGASMNITGAGVVGDGLTVTGTVTATMFSGSGAGLSSGSVSNSVLATGIDATKLTGAGWGITDIVGSAIKTNGSTIATLFTGSITNAGVAGGPSNVTAVVNGLITAVTLIP